MWNKQIESDYRICKTYMQCPMWHCYFGPLRVHLRLHTSKHQHLVLSCFAWLEEKRAIRRAEGFDEIAGLEEQSWPEDHPWTIQFQLILKLYNQEWPAHFWLQSCWWDAGWFQEWTNLKWKETKRFKSKLCCHKGLISLTKTSFLRNLIYFFSFFWNTIKS